MLGDDGQRSYTHHALAPLTPYGPHRLSKTPQASGNWGSSPLGAVPSYAHVSPTMVYPVPMPTYRPLPQGGGTQGGTVAGMGRE